MPSRAGIQEHAFQHVSGLVAAGRLIVCAGHPSAGWLLERIAPMTRSTVYYECEGLESMEELLKRLLEAERQAEAEVRQASAERERLIQEALRQAREAEEQFSKGLPALRAPYTEQALDHAEAAIAELKKKHEERKRQLRELAEQREQSAIEAAVGILLDPQRI